MKNYIKMIFTLLFILLISSTLFAQESDYKITSDFKTNYDSIAIALSNASTVKQVDSLKQEIVLLDDEYFKYDELIDNSIYPSNYKAQIDELKLKSSTAEHRLLIIENQSERLAKLSQEVAYYKSEIAFLNTRADSLRKAIARSEVSEERLAGLVKRYRKNLELRDELVMDVVDSLMITYSGINSIKISEISNQVESGRITGTNPLEMLKNIIDENIEYASNTNKVLTVEDHLRMYALQHHFEEVWNRVGNKMITAYGGTENSEWNTAFTSKIKDWRMVTSQKMWNSMDKYLEFSDVELGAFDNNYSFFIALDGFVKEAQKKSNDEIISNESYQDYKKFQQFWSGKVKNEWSNLIQNTEVLTVAQISSIDEQLSSWEAEARPIHPFLLVLLVLTSISLGGYILVMSKSKKFS
mgnify:CR=1 FL=1|tara:strand:- start:10940 stop:12175 length:1236 start_codon:yes stop_codon:yes gene_type:complete